LLAGAGIAGSAKHPIAIVDQGCDQRRRARARERHGKAVVIAIAHHLALHLAIWRLLPYRIGGSKRGIV